MDIPPIPLFASTQTHNTSLSKIQFLEDAGFSRVILARELSLEQIKEIKLNSGINLEFFVHGALCVCYSGQCYFSFASTGRSANRGECSQPCRMLYDLVDSNGKVIIKDKYLLSLKDLNLSLYLNDLIDAGITSFKIEGRLKDINYVKNVTAFYRRRLDDIIEENSSYSKASSGKVKLFFTPDLEKSFNRGFTDYFVNNGRDSISSFHTPKSTGKQIGKIIAVKDEYYEIETEEKIVNGDGLCFFDDKMELTGISVNKVDRKKIYPNEIKEVKAGTIVYRNNDRAFDTDLSGRYAERKISASIKISGIENSIFICAADEDNCTVEFEWNIEKTPADKPEKAIETLRNQLMKTGDSVFIFEEIEISLPQPYFFPVSKINDLRRRVISILMEKRLETHPFEKRKPARDGLPAESLPADYRGNVTNKLSRKFFNDAGIPAIEEGFELQSNFKGKVLMTCKYCIKNELDICPFKHTEKGEYAEPLYLTDKNRKYRLSFDCAKCEMSVLY